MTDTISNLSPVSVAEIKFDPATMSSPLPKVVRYRMRQSDPEFCDAHGYLVSGNLPKRGLLLHEIRPSAVIVGEDIFPVGLSENGLTFVIVHMPQGELGIFDGRNRNIVSAGNHDVLVATLEYLRMEGWAYGKPCFKYARAAA